MVGGASPVSPYQPRWVWGLAPSLEAALGLQDPQLSLQKGLLLLLHPNQLPLPPHQKGNACKSRLQLSTSTLTHAHSLFPYK